MPEGQPTAQEPEEESLDNTPEESSAASPATEEASVKDPKKPDKKNNSMSGTSDDSTKKVGKFRGSKNIYFYIYILVIILAGLIIAVAYIYNKRAPKTAPTTTKSLTSQQLSQLQGPTTIVGDPKQTLDIQSNAIFEGAVLTRGNMDIAGSLKLGGALSLPNFAATGDGSVGRLAVNGTLGVAGDTTLQGQVTLVKSLTVQGSASVSGAFSAGSISVANFQLTGDLTIARHLIGSGGAPGKTNGTAIGSGGSASLNGSDTAGTVSINTGGSPPAGCFVTINFASKFDSIPHVVVSASNSSAGGLNYYTNRSSTNFSICTANTPTASTTYVFDYIAIQ